MSIELQANNPLGLTTAGPGYALSNPFAYPGQTGNVTSGAGYTFASFGSPQAGIQAGISYLDKYIGQPIGSVIGRAFNGDQASVAQITGLPLSSPLTAQNAPLVAAGIAQGEGTLAAFGGLGSFVNGVTGIFNPGAAAGNALGSALTPGGSNPLDWTGIGLRIGVVVLAVLLLALGVAALALKSDPAAVASRLGRAALA